MGETDLTQTLLRFGLATWPQGLKLEAFRPGRILGGFGVGELSGDAQSRALRVDFARRGGGEVTPQGYYIVATVLVSRCRSSCAWVLAGPRLDAL